MYTGIEDVRRTNMISSRDSWDFDTDEGISPWKRSKIVSLSDDKRKLKRISQRFEWNWFSDFIYLCHLNRHSTEQPKRRMFAHFSIYSHSSGKWMETWKWFGYALSNNQYYQRSPLDGISAISGTLIEREAFWHCFIAEINVFASLFFSREAYRIHVRHQGLLCYSKL